MRIIINIVSIFFLGNLNNYINVSKNVYSHIYHDTQLKKN